MQHEEAAEKAGEGFHAGAVIIAKTGLTELANWVAGAPTPMPGNYNPVGGFGFNPYDPRPDPRNALEPESAGAALMRGAFHVLSLLSPYLEPDQREHLHTLVGNYQKGD